MFLSCLINIITLNLISVNRYHKEFIIKFSEAWRIAASHTIHIGLGKETEKET